jgi:hypothetical protein
MLPALHLARQQRLHGVQRLNLRLLIDTEHRRVRGGSR